MNKVYVVRDAQGAYLGKKDIWVSGREPQDLFVAKFRDQALNQMMERTLKDASLRCTVVEVEVDERDRPLVSVDAALAERLDQQKALALEARRAAAQEAATASPPQAGCEDSSGATGHAAAAPDSSMRQA